MKLILEIRGDRIYFKRNERKEKKKISSKIEKKPDNELLEILGIIEGEEIETDEDRQLAFLRALLK